MRALLPILFILASSFSLFSSELKGEAARKIHPFATSIYLNKAGDVRMVRFEAGTVKSSDDPSKLIREIAQLPAQASVLKFKSEKDELGMMQEMYRLRYGNYLVEGKVFKLNSKDGFVQTLILESPQFSKLKVGSQQVTNKLSDCYSSISTLFKLNAEATFEAENGGNALWIQKDNALILCYKITVSQQKPLLKQTVFVNTNSKKIEKSIERILHIDDLGTATTKYSGVKTITTNKVSTNSYTLREAGRGQGIVTLNYNQGTSSGVDFTNTTNNWVNSVDNVAYDAHYGAEAIYDYYQSKFSRNSFDNFGAQIQSNVHYDYQFVNAFWDGATLTYGDGNGSSYTALTTLDIVGHEFTHAVTEYSAGLEYLDESGALNESFSDIFGIAVDFWKNPTTANWLNGDQCDVTGHGFRNMSDPNSYGDPDTYFGNYWVTDGSDNGGVHTNSNVQNYWFYLLSIGGSGTNDNGTSYSITAIGMDDAAKIAYRTLTNYLTTYSNYEDARAYSIAAAIDLFGECSVQVIQTANAWNAVGVGDPYSNSVTANFTVNQQTGCSVPFTVNFTNTSTNASTFGWNFGDGGVSSSSNPSHTYTNAGNYTVTLTVSGTAGCGGSDVETKTNFISASSLGAPIAAVCSPTNTPTSSNYGISQVKLGNLNKVSSNSSEGHKNFTCEGRADLIAGGTDSLFVKTFSMYESVKVWIDYNNDGDFTDTGELIYTFTETAINHATVLTFPTTMVKNVPLRMRVIDDANSYVISSACSNPQYGQAEDYTVIFTDATLAPVADFTSNFQTVVAGGSVNYFQYCQNAPTSFSWSFPGGTPSTSTLANPTIQYSTVGTYAATLIATNAFGSDTIQKVNYISVNNTINMCSGTTVTTSPQGTLYDSGGLNGSYLDGENCSLLIDPGCASSISILFSEFNSESGFDYLNVYDGTSSASPLLYTLTGYLTSQLFTATSGTMFITWSSDGSVTAPGFVANWSSVLTSTSAPVADFSASTTSPALNTFMSFTDLSSNTPSSWMWNFGDGTTSVLQNPTKSYSTSGVKQVRLIAYTCNNSDTITKTITVQNAPELEVSPLSYTLGLSCGDSTTLPLVIKNNSGGLLNFTTENIEPVSTWLTVAELSDSLVAGDSLVMNVQFNSNSLIAGTYLDTIYLFHNQTTGGYMIIPCSFTVTGDPILTLTQTCLNFGSTLQGVPLTDSLLISNDGCSDLTLAFQSTNSDFLLAEDTITILPYSSQWVDVTLLSVTSGALDDTLFFTNGSAIDTFVCLTATILPAPVVSFLPDTLEATITICRDSVNIPVQIINTGDSTLVYSTLTPTATKNVLVYTFGVDLTTSGEYNNLVNSINAHYTDYNLFTTSTTTASQLTADLSNKSVLVIPKLETTSLSHWTTFAPVLQNFVANGGTVIICGTSSSYSCINNSGLLSTISTGSATGYTMNILNPSHPIFQNYTGTTMSLPYYSYYNRISNTDFVSLANYSSSPYHMVGYRPIGSGKVVYLGFDFYSRTAQTDLIAANTLKWALTSQAGAWIDLSPQAGSVSPHDTINTIVTLSTTDFINGYYNGNYLLATNDPAHPTLAIPCSLTISADPEINLNETCIDFGSVIQGVVKTDSVLISNTGCGNLNVQVSSTNVGVTTNLTTLSVLPGSSTWLRVTIQTSTIGAFSSTINLLNNDVDTSICITATVLAPPVIFIVPNPVVATATTCDQIVSVPVQVTNTGLSNLTYSTLSANKNVLAYTNGADMAVGGKYEKLISSINTYYTDYTLTTTSTTSAVQLQADLVGKAIFLIPTITSSSISHWSNFATVLQNFVSNGGTVIITGSNSSSYYYSYYAGLISQNTASFNSGNITISNASHPIFQGVNTPVSAPANTFLLNSVQNSDYTSLGKVNGKECVGYRTVGSGKIILMGFDFATVSDNVSKMVSNAVEWTLHSNAVNWVSLSPTSGTVSAGGSQASTLVFNTTGMTNGTYTGSYPVISNDPANSTYQVPFTLTIQGQPAIATSSTCLNYGLVYQGIAVEDSVTITNTGCANLILTSITYTNSDFTSTFSPLTLTPGASTKVVVHYTPSSLGNISANLLINGNLSEVQVCLTATSVGTPDIVVDPAVITATFNNCMNPTTVSFEIQNQGQASLDYSINLAQVNKKILAYTYNVSTTPGSLYANTIAAINTHYTDYTLTTTTTFSAATLESQLADKHVLLFTAGQSTSFNFAQFSTVINNFVNRGGIVLFCGSTNLNPMFQSGALQGSFYNDYYGYNTYNIGGNHPIVANVPTSYYTSYYAYEVNITSPSWNKLLYTYSNTSLAGELIKGDGKVIYLGYDFMNSGGTYESQLIANAVEYAVNQPIAISWVNSVQPSSGTIAANGNQIVTVDVNVSAMNVGLNAGTVIINSNDIDEPSYSIPFNITKDSIDLCLDFTSVISSCDGIVDFSSQYVPQGATLQWRFGNGASSTIGNPSCEYMQSGSYDVEMIVCNQGACDTIVHTITVGTIIGAKPALCEPQTVSTCCNAGITKVQLNGINHQSGNAVEGYSDYTCQATTTLFGGSDYVLKVNTSTQTNESVYAWIDYNNDGSFSFNEKVFASLDGLSLHTGTISIPSNGIATDVPVRMRVISESPSIALQNACTDLTSGQAEDYSVVLRIKGSGVGLDENLIDGLSLVPNPTSEQFYIKGLADGVHYTIELMDVNGKLILSSVVVGSEPIDVRQLEPGAYFVRTKQGQEEMKNQKLMIVR